MWNKIAGNSAPPQGARPPVMAQDDEDMQEVASGAPNDESEEDAGQGQDQGEGEMQAGNAGGPEAGQLPPDVAQHVDPNNPVQMTLVKRALAMTPQDAKTFFEGVTVPAIQVLKKIVPELGFIFDRAIAASGHQQGAAPGANGTPQVSGAMPPPAAPAAPQQQKSQLFRV